MRQLFLCIMILGTAAFAGAQDVFPPMSGGDFVFAAMNPCPPLDPQGVPLEPPGLSISIEPLMGGPSILCMATPVCDTRVTGTAKVTATGQREAFVGYAYTEAGCIGLASDASDERAYTYPGQKPGKARLVE